MKEEQVAKLFVPGVIASIILGFGLGMFVGVNPDEKMPNYIAWALCCFIPTILNCVIVLENGAKILKKELPMSQALARIFKYAVFAFMIGFIIVFIMDAIFGVNPCTLTNFMAAVGQSVMGVIVSTGMAYVSLRRYEEYVKTGAKYASKKKKA